MTNPNQPPEPSHLCPPDIFSDSLQRLSSHFPPSDNKIAGETEAEVAPLTSIKTSPADWSALLGGYCWHTGPQPSQAHGALSDYEGSLVRDTDSEAIPGTWNYGNHNPDIPKVGPTITNYAELDLDQVRKDLGAKPVEKLGYTLLTLDDLQVEL